MSEKYEYWGKLGKTHGYKGEITFWEEGFLAFKTNKPKMLYVQQNKSYIPLAISEIKPLGDKRLIFNLLGIDSQEKAKKMTDALVYVEKSDLKKIKVDANSPSLCIDYTIEDVNLGQLGRIREIMNMPTQDVFLMPYLGKEVLIPAIFPILDKIDHELKIVYVHLPEGLLELYLDVKD